ncbi:hypothetical protein PLICRDRAFT_67635, partial [Plicaturopsis crispa FD-325 SS-3]
EPYWHALSQVGSAFRIDPYLWVLQDWDEQRETLRIGVYHHIIRLPRGPNDYGIACTCSQWRARNVCTHLRIVEQYTPFLLALPFIAPIPTPPAVLLHSTPFQDHYVFSCVSSVGRYESSKRTVVSLQKDGRWHCHSMGKGSVSHMPIAPPKWCSLSSELPSATVRPPSGPVHYPLDETARCRCGLSLADACTVPLSNPAAKPAVIYGLTQQISVTIALIPCPLCQHARRQLGPDLGQYAVFNWNNSMLFSHELLNAFTNAYTASETPFSAFCLTVRRAYMDHGPSNTFCSDDTFVRVWFAFTELQDLDSGMQCPTCGPSPKIVIADGISLGTHHSKLTGLVNPPTRVTQSSERIDSISSYKARALPAIIQVDMRALVNKMLDITATRIPPDGGYPDMSKLFELYPDLAQLINLYVINGTSSRHFKAYRNFIQQIAAPDIVLQLVPFDAIEHFREFSRSLSDAPEWIQLLCPALGTLLRTEQMGDCNKFFKTYSKNNLTGGILVL